MQAYSWRCTIKTKGRKEKTMKREQITEILKTAGLAEDKLKEVSETIFAEYGKDITAEKDKLTAKENELSAANKQIKELNTTIESFGGQTPTELKTQLGNLQKKYDDDIAAEQKKYSDLVKTQSLKEALTGAGVLDTDYLIYKHGGIEKFAFADGKPVGIDETLKPYRESSPSLFKVETKPKEGLRHEGGTQVKEITSDHAEANKALRSFLGKE